MRAIIIFFILTIISLQSFSQTPYRKKVIHKTTRVLVEEYDTKDSLSNVKIGFYARFNPNTGKMTKTGSFKENVRTGLWTFYDDSSKISYKHNYSTGMTVFSKPDTLAKYFLKQSGVDTNFYSGLQSLPVFIGGAGEFRDFIAANLRYPSIAKENEITGTVIATFFVGANGFTESPKIVKGLGYGCDDEVIRVINLMPKWIPGRKVSEVRQQYYMTFKFEPKK